jgi:hypothetical protein
LKETSLSTATAGRRVDEIRDLRDAGPAEKALARCDAATTAKMAERAKRTILSNEMRLLEKRMDEEKVVA